MLTQVQGTRGIYTMLLHGDRRDSSYSCGFEYSHTSEIMQIPPDRLHIAQDSSQRTDLRCVPRAKLESRGAFEKVVALCQPVILEGLDIGSCTSQWTLDYLSRKIGSDRKVLDDELEENPIPEESSIKNTDHRWA